MTFLHILQNNKSSIIRIVVIHNFMLHVKNGSLVSMYM